MQTVLPAQVIIPLATQLETTYSEYRENLSQIEESQNVENGGIIDFKKLNEWIEHQNVQRLDISIHHPIFLEIKKMFDVILTMDRSSIDGWKYKNTFLNVGRYHYDKYEAKKVQFMQMNWIDSFVTSFIWHLYH
jgi:hypothetical protein